MAFDTLKSSVKEYGDKKSVLNQDQQSFDIEQDELDDLLLFSSRLDSGVISSIKDIQNDFLIVKSNLDSRADNLDKEREDIGQEIKVEQTKLDTVKRRMELLSRNKYTSGLEKVNKKNEELITQLDKIMEELGEEGSTRVSDFSTTLDKQIDAKVKKIDNSQSNKENEGGFLSRLFKKHQATSNGPKFGNFDLDVHKNGSNFFVKGTNYEQFVHNYYFGQSSYESLEGKEIVATISPGSIEGISLGSSEAKDSSLFWSQHDSNGTKESFVEIASHIPEVKALLDSGVSLSKIKEDPDLQKCANIYFDPSHMPRVIQNDGYYEFEANGRHRILAAREAGYDIPVRIVGRRTWQ